MTGVHWKNINFTEPQQVLYDETGSESSTALNYFSGIAINKGKIHHFLLRESFDHEKLSYIRFIKYFATVIHCPHLLTT